MRAGAACDMNFDLCKPTRWFLSAVAPGHIALVGNALPRLCGLATFTSHVRDALPRSFPAMTVDHYAMVDPGRSYRFPEAVTATIEQDDPASYRAAARSIMASGAELVWIQHEFGIFGGPAGAHLLELLDHLDLPVAVTLHTVLDRPDPYQRRVVEALAARCELLIVMAQRARSVLERTYSVPRSQIVVVPHGIPDRAYEAPADARARLGLDERPTILTFGLLSPGKGIESMIRALPAIASRAPEVRYVVAGATHPNLVAAEGESYRERLQALAQELRVARHLQWVDRFLPEQELLEWIAAADLYVTPYINPAQVTSGTLAYAFGLGKPIVSTPYVHAAELLSADSGLLVPFGDGHALANAVGHLLTDETARNAHAAAAYRRARAMTWRRTTEQAVRSMLPLIRPRAILSCYPARSKVGATLAA